MGDISKGFNSELKHQFEHFKCHSSRRRVPSVYPELKWPFWTRTLVFSLFYCAGMSRSSRRSAVLSSLTWSLRFASRTTVRPVRPSSSTCCPSSQWRLDLVLSSQVPSFRLTDCPRQKQPLKFYAFSDLKERDKCKTIWQKSHKFHQIFRPRRSTGALFFWGGGTGHCVPSVFANLMFVCYFVSLSARTSTDSEALSL